MAELTVERFIARQKASGDKEIGSSFSKKAVRSMEFNALEVGDVLTFPSEYQVLKNARLSRPATSTTNAVSAEYIVVPNQNGSPRAIYPGMFMKSQRIVEEVDGQIVNVEGNDSDIYLRSKGTAVDLFQTKDDVAEAMNLLKGKTIRVDNREVRKVRGFGDRSNEMVDSTAYTFNLVEGKK